MNRNFSVRGVSLIEMLIAMGLAMFIMSATYMLYAQSRAWLEKPRASYNIQEDIMQLARWVQRDLEETNLMTVQSFPNPSTPGERPGLAFESARSFDGDLLVLSEYGNVRWQKYVYYTLVPVDGTVGNIVRVEGPLEDQPSPLDTGRRVPIKTNKLPSASDIPKGRVVARNVLLPNLTANASQNLPATDQYGGFKITSLLPGETMGPLVGGAVHEEPIRIDLALAEISKQTLKASMLRMTLQVIPRN